MISRHLAHLLYGEGLLLDDVSITAGIGTAVATSLRSGRNFQVTETLPHSGKEATISSVIINTTVSMDLVALVAAQKIRVMGLDIIADGGAVKVNLKDGTTPTDMTPPLPLADKGNWFLPITGEPWFQTAAGAKLSIVLSAAVQISGRLYYQQGT